MIKAFIGFNKGILAMAKLWQVWMVLLVSANMVAPWFFLGTLEAIVTLVGVMIGMLLMMVLFARYGFVRLLGLGHLPWFFTVPWLLHRLDEAVGSGPFYYWLLAVITLNSISLIIDTVDVIRYLKGDRQPTIAAHGNAI